MNYHVVCAPDLGVNTRELIAAWNSTPECRALAEARPGAQPATAFALDPKLLHDGLVWLAGAASTLALDIVKDVVKERVIEYLKQRSAAKRAVKVESVRQPDGTYLLVVTGAKK